MPQRAYVWQRDWNPQVSRAVTAHAAEFDTLDVLAGQLEFHASDAAPYLIRPAIDWETLHTAAKPIGLAVRVQRTGDGYAVAEEVTRLLLARLEEAGAASVPIAEFQIDYDCPQKSLDAYRQWLLAVRENLRPTGIPLRITTLPSWLGEPAFVKLIDGVDGYILQVHSFDLTAIGKTPSVCDPAMAREWVSRAAKLGRPFYVALPTYRCLAGYAPDGHSLGIAADAGAPSWPRGTRVLEFSPDAGALAELVAEWTHTRPAAMQGLYWYRLPVDGETYNWRWPTLAAVMAGRAPVSKWEVRAAIANPTDFILCNTGETDEPLPQSIRVSWSGPSSAVVADALGGWSCHTAADRVEYRPASSSGATGWRLEIPFRSAGFAIARLRRLISPSPMKSPARWMPGLSLLLTAVMTPCALHATGGWVPDRFLDDGGQSLKQAPEFYWDIELTRLAKQYAGKDLPPKFKAGSTDETGIEAKATSTANADNADFEDALKEGKLKPADPAAAHTAQTEMRNWLQKGAKEADQPKSTEADSEFADYHKGAALFAAGKTDEARAAWDKLLKRPEAERRYRTVWAAFMLGKAGMKDEKTRADAIAWFVKCREYAREGFADSLNLAGDSIGWQARAEYDSGDRPAAARHYLQQLALGDTSALASLKLLVPDREEVSELSPLSFETLGASSSPDEIAPVPDKTDAEKKADAAKAQRDLAIAAKDEVLHQIVTAHILCASSEGSDHSRGTHWLETIEKVKPEHVEGAASLGWVAYSAGKFDEAKRWAQLDKPATPLGEWLQAKLALRAGDFSAAAGFMAKVVPQLPDDTGARYDTGYLPKSEAAADLGASLLAQGKLNEAFAAFWSGGCWFDAAYLAEHVLTTDELLAFVKTNAMLSNDERAHPPDNDDPNEDAFPEYNTSREGVRWRMKDQLMNLAGRRLIREDRNAEGGALLGGTPRRLYEQFRALGAIGRDAKKPKMERGKALFDAARILRDGSSWCGTVDDVIRVEGGGYAPDNPDGLIQSRVTGKSKPSETGDAGDAQSKPAANFIPSAESERKRLSQIHVAPMKQYVHQAAALALQAAALLPDDAEETADVLNQAGRWIQDLDNPGADKIYYQIEKRCAKTTIGKAVIAKHWFIEPNGPWTKEPEESTPDDKSQEGLPR